MTCKWLRLLGIREMNEQPIGVCKHGKPIHFGYPCPMCEGELVADQIFLEIKAGWKPENGLHERIVNLVGACVKDIEDRVRTHCGGKGGK